MAETKKKDGRYYLKKKYEALKIEHEELQKSFNHVLKTQIDLQVTVEKQASQISKLNLDVHNAETRRIKENFEHKQLVDELFKCMGWFRRLIWKFDHAEKR